MAPPPQDPSRSSLAYRGISYGQGSAPIGRETSFGVARAAIGCRLGGESVKISLVDGNLLSLRTGDFALFPFTIDFGDAASAEAADPQEQPAAEAGGAQTSGEVTPEFKEMMDSHEAFMNQYCDLMVKYVNATDSGESAAACRKNTVCLRFNFRSPRINPNPTVSARHLPGEIVKSLRKLRLRQN